MSDYSSYTERDAFNEALCNLIEEYLQDQNIYPVETVLAINTKTMEIELGAESVFDSQWEKYSLATLIRINEDNTGKEADIDATHELASKYYFVR